MRGLRRLYLRIQEPRVVSIIQWLIYLVTLGIGVTAFQRPPSSIEGALGVTLTTIWAVFLIVGGVLGAIAALPGIWWLERVAVLACVTGALMYGSVVLNLHYSETGNRLPQLGFVAIAILAFTQRWFRIRRYAYDPER
ncbi:hypothetical protein [Oerskovia jenensis]|uniref:hypothetical protein n=1 Tax=Oerskovia jenensis TaxID=162169 RepID=UPI0036DF8ED6